MLSTRQAAKKLGIGAKTLSHYIAIGKVPAPTILKVGSASLHAWTEEEVDEIRKLLPKIANGRRKEHKKQSAKPKPEQRSAQPRAAVPHKQRSTKKKSKP